MLMGAFMETFMETFIETFMGTVMETVMACAARECTHLGDTIVILADTRHSRGLNR